MNPSTLKKLFSFAVAVLMAGAANVQAQTTQIKAANATALNSGGSWVSTTAPGTGDIGLWNNVATATGDTITTIGGAYSLGEIQIGNNVAGAVSITDATVTDILTLNGVTSTGVGVDMSAANQNLTIGTPLTIGASQTWKIASGKSLSLTGVNNIAFGANILTISGGGTVNYNPTVPVTTATTSSAGAGLIINNSTLSIVIQKTASSAYVNYLGANTALTMTGNSIFNAAEVGTSGNHKQTFTSLILNPGADLFQATPGRGSSSGNSVGFTALTRNGGSMADFAVASGSPFGGSANAYGLPGTTVLGYATIGANDWALPKGAATIMVASTYTSDTWASANNTTVTTSSAPSSGSTVNSLRFNAASAFTVTLTGVNIINSGGILVGSTVAANNSTITGGTLTSGNANADSTHDLIVINNTASSGNIIINSVIADNGASAVGLTIGSTSVTTPTGSVQLGAANTFSGITYISKGTLLLNHSLALQNSTLNTSLAGTLSFGSLTAATFAGLAGTGNLVLPTSFALTVGNNNVSSAYSGALSGSGATLTKTGSGTFTLNGANANNGGTIVSSGTLALGASGSVSGTISINTGAILDVSAAGGYSLNNTIQGQGFVTGSLTDAVGGKISPNGDGIVGTNTFNNNLALNGGTCYIDIDVGNSTNDQIKVAGSLTLTSGTVQLNIFNGTVANGTYRLINCTGTPSGSAANIAVSGFSQSGQAASLQAVAGGLNLVVTPYVAKSLVWQGDGSANLWDVGTSTTWTNGATPSVFNNSDITTLDDSSPNQTVNLTGTLSPGSVTVNGTKSYTFTNTGKISGSAGLTNNSSGTLTILTANDYSGGTVINSGTVQVGNGITTGAIGSGNVVDNGVLNFNLPSGGQSIGAANGTGTLTKQGAGTLTLNGANTLAGSTIVTSGTLKQGSANVLPNGSGVGDTVVNGTLDMGGLNGTINGLTGSGVIDSTLAGTPILSVTGNGIFTGVIQNTAGSLALNMNGNGKQLTLSTANTFSGGTTVTAGTLQLGNNNAISSGNLNVLASAIFDLNNFSPTINGLSGAGTIDSTAAGSMTLSIGNTGGGGTFSGAIKNTTGTVNLTKNGLGTEILTGNNTYTGSTTVNAGVLKIDPSGAISGGATTISAAQLLVSGGSFSATTGSLQQNSVLTVSSGLATFSGALSNPNGTTVYSIAASGGSLTASSVSLLRSGTTFNATPSAGDTSGNFYINGASVNIIGALTMTTDASSANVRIDSGSLAVGGILTIECNNSRWSVVDVNGGLLTDNDTSGIGISIGGTVVGPAELLVRGTGTAITPKITFGQTGNTTACVLNMLGTGSVYIGSGGMVQGGSVAPTITLGGISKLGATADWSSPLAMTLAGGTIQAADTNNLAHNITLSGTLSGAGNLLKTGAGTLTLSAGAGNIYAGTNLISAGTLLVNNTTGSGTGSSNVWVTAGTLAGTGIIGGATTVQSGGTLQPGLGGTDTSTLTISNTLALAGNAVFILNRGNAQNAAKVAGVSTVTYGGTLTVTNTGAALISGDTFNLFSATTYTGNFATVILPALTSGLAWNTNNLTTTGTISVQTSISPVTLLVVSSSNPSGFNDAINFTAGVTPTNATGTIIFITNGAPWITNSLAAGLVTSANISNLPRGTNVITSVYSGDVNYYGATNNINQVVTNHPPVAGNATYGRNPGIISLHIAISELLTNVSDIDTDLITLTATGVSTNGITLTSNGTYLLYQNTNAVNDQFTYTVSDGNGGSATGLVTVVAQPFATGQNASVTVSGSTATVSFAGIPGYNYGIQRSTNLVGSWVTIRTTNAPAGGLFDWTDDFNDLGVVPASAYYRLQWNP